MTAIVLCGDVTSDLTLAFGNSYILACTTVVTANSTLTIEPGVTIVAAPSDSEGAKPALVVLRGAKLIANGTANAPITFTALLPGQDSREEAVTDTETVNGTITAGLRGKWGGLVILGRAPTSHGAATSFEALPGYHFGGIDPEDSSGILRYVRVWHAGAIVEANREINGLTFAGVGRGTIVEHCEVAFSLDDGFEFFGGTVNVRWLSALFNGDDAFDIDLGYVGTAQFLFAMLGNGGDRGLEVTARARGACLRL